MRHLSLAISAFFRYTFLEASSWLSLYRGESLEACFCTCLCTHTLISAKILSLSSYLTCSLLFTIAYYKGIQQCLDEWLKLRSASDYLKHRYAWGEQRQARHRVPDRRLVTTSDQKQQPFTECDGCRQDAEPFKVMQDHKAQCARAKLESCCWIYKVKTQIRPFSSIAPAASVSVPRMLGLRMAHFSLCSVVLAALLPCAGSCHETASRWQSGMAAGSSASRSDVCNLELRRGMPWLKWQAFLWI